ncbi:MAG: GrpB family protein [Planctomycetota bacterium]
MTTDRSDAERPRDDGLGLAGGTVRLSPYSDRWPGAFGAMRDDVVRTISGLGHVATEHIGSTAVEGMASKPLIDLMVGLERLNQHEACVGPLESLGYAYKGEFGLPGRHFFVLGEPAIAHLHLVEHRGHFWRLNLRFRAILREDPHARERYLAVKRSLAAAHANDRPAYTAGKDAIINELLREHGWEG